MKQVHLAARIFLLGLIGFFFQAFSTRAGGDYFKVLLNNKLVTEQFLHKKCAVKTLSLASSNSSDQLTVYYSHCGVAGKERSVLLKTSSGKLLGKWNFTDSKTIEVQLPVKEVMKVSGKNSSASLYYASKEIPQGKELITVNFSNKAIARL